MISPTTGLTSSINELRDTLSVHSTNHKAHPGGSPKRVGPPPRGVDQKRPGGSEARGQAVEDAACGLGGGVPVGRTSPQVQPLHVTGGRGRAAQRAGQMVDGRVTRRGHGVVEVCEHVPEAAGWPPV